MNIKLLLAVYLCFTIALSIAPAQIAMPDYNYGSQDILKAKTFFDIRLLQKSEDMVRNAIRNFPESASRDKAALLQAEIEIASENYILADAYLEQFINTRQNSPLIPSALLMRAFLTYHQQRFDPAEQLFRKAAESATDNFNKRQEPIYAKHASTAWFWRGVSLAQQGKYQDAQPIFLKCYELYPNEDFADDALFMLGQIEELNRHYDKAIEYYSRCIGTFPISNIFIAARTREVNNRLILRESTQALLIIEKTQHILNSIFAEDSIGKLYETQSFSEDAAEELHYLRGEANNLEQRYQRALSIFDSFLQTYYQSKFIDYALLGAGWASLNLGENERALTYYDDIIQKGISDSREYSIAQLFRTVALKRMGETEQAKKELSALTVQPTYPFLALALLELGQLYYENEDYENARRTLERAEREARDAIVSIRIHVLLGATYLEQRKWTNAVKHYSSAEILALKSSEIFMPNKEWYLSESRLKQGIALVKSYNNMEAIPILSEFIAENSADTRVDEALFWQGEAYYRANLLKNSIEIYNKLLNMFPRSKRREETLYSLGWSHFRLKDFENSSSIFDNMIKEFPESKYGIEVLTRQADGYYYLKRYRNAADAYRKAARFAPNTVEGQYSAYQLCHALYRLGSYEQAITELMSFVRTYSQSSYSPFAIYLIGWIRFQQRKYDEAIENFNFLIQAYPQSELIVRAHYSIADALYNKGDFQSAINKYQSIVEIFPSSAFAPEAMKGVHYCYMALGQREKAMEIIENLIASYPSSPIAEDLAIKKIELFYSGRNYSDAVQENERFIKQYPKSEKVPQALYWKAKSYIKLGEPDKAESTFNEIRRNFPDNDYAPLGLIENALLQKELGNIQKADSLLLSLERYYPEHQTAPQASFERALIPLGMGDTAKAMNIFRYTSRTYPKTEYADQSYYRIAMYHRSRNNLDSSRMIFEILANSYESPFIAAEAQYRIGELWIRQENCEKAIESFKLVKERFLGYEDWYSLALLSMGECLEKQNKNIDAIDIYREIIALRPDDDFGMTANRRIKHLERKR